MVEREPTPAEGGDGKQEGEIKKESSTTTKTNEEKSAPVAAAEGAGDSPANAAAGGVKRDGEGKQGQAFKKAKTGASPDTSTKKGDEKAEGPDAPTAQQDTAPSGNANNSNTNSNSNTTTTTDDPSHQPASPHPLAAGAAQQPVAPNTPGNQPIGGPGGPQQQPGSGVGMPSHQIQQHMMGYGGGPPQPGGGGGAPPPHMMHSQYPPQMMYNPYGGHPGYSGQPPMMQMHPGQMPPHMMQQQQQQHPPNTAPPGSQTPNAPEGGTMQQQQQQPPMPPHQQMQGGQPGQDQPQQGTPGPGGSSNDPNHRGGPPPPPQHHGQYPPQGMPPGMMGGPPNPMQMQNYMMQYGPGMFYPMPGGMMMPPGFSHPGMMGPGGPGGKPPQGYMQAPPPRSSGIPLALSCDDEQLSEYQMLVRKQLEIFEAQPEDVESNTQGRKKQVVLGQVGIRCRHCAGFPLRQRGRGAVYYPAKLQGVYQASQNMASSHLCESCQCIPPGLKGELRGLRDRRDTASGGKQYWADGARAMGLHETEEGLRLHRPDHPSRAVGQSPPETI